MGDRPGDGRDPSGFTNPSLGSVPQGDASITNSLYGDRPPADDPRSDDPMADSAALPDLAGESAGETSFTQTTQVSWFQKMSEAIGGVLVGLAMVVVTAGLLFWNEGRAVQTSRSLTEGSGLVVAVANDRVDPANEGKLIHLQGELASGRPVADPALGVEARAARLVRHVEMYQWKEETETETVKRVGGGEERRTTYTYRRVWSNSRNASERFNQQAGHQNPDFRFRSFEAVAQDAALGAFRPGEKALLRLSSEQPFAIDAAEVATALGQRPGIGPVFADGGGLYLGQDSNNPRIGDLRVTYSIAPLGPTSFIGRQVGAGLDEYQTKAGDRLLMAQSGLAPASRMFAGAQAENRTLTWLIRFGGALVMWIGFTMVLRPIAVVGDVIPIVGTVLGAGIAVAALAMTAMLAPLVIAIAWFFYRPLVSLGIVVAGAAVAYGLRTLAQKRRAAAGANATRAGMDAPAGARPA